VEIFRVVATDVYITGGEDVFLLLKQAGDFFSHFLSAILWLHPSCPIIREFGETISKCTYWPNPDFVSRPDPG